MESKCVHGLGTVGCLPRLFCWVSHFTNDLGVRTWAAERCLAWIPLMKLDKSATWTSLDMVSMATGHAQSSHACLHPPYDMLSIICYCNQDIIRSVSSSSSLMEQYTFSRSISCPYQLRSLLDAEQVLCVQHCTMYKYQHMHRSCKWHHCMFVTSLCMWHH